MVSQGKNDSVTQFDVDLDNHFGFLLEQCSFLVNKTLLGHLKEKGHQVSFVELMILLRLKPRRSVTAKEITEQTLKDKAVTAKLLKRLEMVNLIERAPNPADARSQLIHITSGGTKIVKDAVKFMAQFDQRFMERISPDRVAELTKTLKEMLDEIRAWSDGIE